MGEKEKIERLTNTLHDLITASTAMKIDLLQRADVADGVKVVDVNSAIWRNFNATLERSIGQVGE